MIRDPDLNSLAQRLRERVRIADLLEQRGVKVRRLPNGTAWGLCPLHTERTPSFKIAVSKKDGIERFRCFGCERWGDVFDLAQILGNHPNYVTTLRALAQEYGITFPERQPETLRTDLQVLDLTAQHYVRTLSPEVLQYLAERGFPKEFVKDAGIGFAPPGGLAGLTRALAFKSLTQPAVDLGVLLRDQDVARERFSSRIAGYIIFPTRLNGHVVDLQGRIFPPAAEGAKYLSLPGPHRALYHEADAACPEVVLCEGVPDTLSVLRAGFRAVGLYGKRDWRPAYYQRFTRCRRVYVALDRDATGEATKIARTFGPRGRVLVPPESLGPEGDLNDWFRGPAQRDPEIFRSVLATAMRHAPTGWQMAIRQLPRDVPVWGLAPDLAPC